MARLLYLSLLLIAALVPMKAAAHSGMPCAGTKVAAWSSVWLDTAPTAHSAVRESPTQLADTMPAQPAEMRGHADPGHDGRCSACGPCCAEYAGPAIDPASLLVDPPYLAFAGSAPPVPDVAHDGPERPPRT